MSRFLNTNPKIKDSIVSVRLYKNLQFVTREFNAINCQILYSVLFLKTKINNVILSKEVYKSCPRHIYRKWQH